ncbi:hypothetical protein ACIQV3_27555 [Streptomyces sp. NPDC099050]|uniref:hypothetical protein n=1 Tax=Streptomyces sp. NPDC099050 TaxID=3366100 RepID=UPI0037F1C42E
MDSSEYDEYEAVVRVRKGARFVRSRKTTGAHRGMTRDPDSHEVGQAEIFLKEAEEEENEPDPVEDYPQDRLDSDPQESQARAQERREEAEFLAEVLVQIGLRLAEKAAPHVRKWWFDQALPAVKAKWNDPARTSLKTKWNDRALPSVKAKWSSVARSRTSERRAEAVEDPQEIVTAEGDERTTMSGADARKRIAAAVTARLFSDGQLRLVRKARIVEEAEDGPVELDADDLTPQRIGEYVALMLEANPSLLGEDTLAELGQLIANIRADGGRVPLPRAEGMLPHDDGNERLRRAHDDG